MTAEDTKFLLDVEELLQAARRVLPFVPSTCEIMPEEKTPHEIDCPKCRLMQAIENFEKQS